MPLAGLVGRGTLDRPGLAEYFAMGAYVVNAWAIQPRCTRLSLTPPGTRRNGTLL